MNMRPAIASVPPVLRAIQRDLGLSGAAAGMLTALPVVCLGVFAPPAARLAERWGAERVVALSLAVLGAGTLARAAGGIALFPATLLAGVGIAVGSALLPGLVKAYFPARAGTVTGIYTTGLVAGAMLASGLTVPLEHLLGGSWQLALAAWSLLAAAALAAWVPVTRRPLAEQPLPGGQPPPVGPGEQPPPGGPGEQPLPGGPGPLLWRSPVAWAVALYMGLQSLLFYSTLTWLSPLYQDRGWSAERGGALLALFSFVQLFSSLALPTLADRSVDRRPWVALSVGSCTAGLAVLALAPMAAPWLVVAVTGFGVGGQFALVLTLLVDLSADPAAARRLSGVAFFVGYLLAASGPALIGALYDATGDFIVPFLVLTVLGVVTFVIALSIRPGARI